MVPRRQRPGQRRRSPRASLGHHELVVCGHFARRRDRAECVRAVQSTALGRCRPASTTCATDRPPTERQVVGSGPGREGGT